MFGRLKASESNASIFSHALNRIKETNFLKHVLNYSRTKSTNWNSFSTVERLWLITWQAAVATNDFIGCYVCCLNYKVIKESDAQVIFTYLLIVFKLFESIQSGAAKIDSLRSDW